jgi:hypothetical protein
MPWFVWEAGPLGPIYSIDYIHQKGIEAPAHREIKAYQITDQEAAHDTWEDLIKKYPNPEAKSAKEQDVPEDLEWQGDPGVGAPDQPAGS